MSEVTKTQNLPIIIAGPILRHVTEECLTLWLASSIDISQSSTLVLSTEDGGVICGKASNKNSGIKHHSIPLGKKCFINLIELTTKLPLDTNIRYELRINGESVFSDIEGLAYDDKKLPVFSVKPQIKNLLHGSCRKPHHNGDDALVAADKLLSETYLNIEAKPSLMIFSGDQVYADDVAGPMLVAIHQVIETLELFDEAIEGADISSFAELKDHHECFYQRPSLLPDDNASRDTLDIFFGGARKPIFTTVNAHNHLITLSELIAMYLLVWSDTPWDWVDLNKGTEKIPSNCLERFEKEKHHIEDFAKNLSKVRRLLAHVPTYMIFDDHDITDDWNLTRGWEETAYNNPFSRRIIGNSLIAYWLCQGWGNDARQYNELTESATRDFSTTGIENHEAFVDRVLNWEHWHFHLDTKPKIVVLDTRTHRWRSERSPGKPSGLMDWESLSELQQELINQPQVIMVSPAPVFGVKIIETIQRVFTFFGKPLMVDAENWMAHPGAANVILNIFRHIKTPPQFIILSGDVHYSFAYDITLRRRKNSPRILQVTASGIKNSFPDKLIRVFDQLNQIFYGRRSPLNFLTKRRDMRIKQRRPDNKPKSTLLNHSGIGELVLADDIKDIHVLVHSSEGKTVEFKHRVKRNLD